MGNPTATHVCLIRGINVGGHRKVSMPELRTLLCMQLGWKDVRTYIQSGNLVVRTDLDAPEIEARLEQVLEQHFGVAAAVLVRSAAEWQQYVASNPFTTVSDRESNLVMLALAKAAPNPNAVEVLRGRASSGERVEQSGDALWIHYAGGAGRSKLSPGLLDRAVGSPVTTRNLRTVMALAEMTLSDDRKQER